MPSALVDTDVLVYLVDAAEEKKHAKALAWLRAQEPHLGELAVLPQNLREFCAVFWKKKARANAREINDWLDSLACAFDVLDESREDVKKANGLAEKHGVSFWDALIASAMARNQIRTIYTENLRDFSKFPGIRPVNPVALA